MLPMLVERSRSPRLFLFAEVGDETCSKFRALNCRVGTITGGVELRLECTGELAGGEFSCTNFPPGSLAGPPLFLLRERAILEMASTLVVMCLCAVVLVCDCTLHPQDPGSLFSYLHR